MNRRERRYHAKLGNERSVARAAHICTPSIRIMHSGE
jgi:hypothetical protein